MGLRVRSAHLLSLLAKLTSVCKTDLRLREVGALMVVIGRAARIARDRSSLDPTHRDFGERLRAEVWALELG